MKVVDSHTEGEPTRLVVSGGPDLGSGSMSERLSRFSREHDGLRRAIVLEPRGHDALVGALLCEPVDPGCAAGLIFFNNAGFLGMCGHATVGAAVSLAWLGRIGIGRHRFETPAGTVSVDLVSPNEAIVENVESRRHARDVRLSVPGLGTVVGDVAYGGNWFFLVKEPALPLDFARIAELTDAASRVRAALVEAGVTGTDGAEIDHVEFFGPAGTPEGHSRNFVLCPGGAYDRSPCGTGSSAKLACLAADGKLAPGDTWVQESIIGSRFMLSYRPGPSGGILPTIRGRAFVVAEATLIRDPADPFVDGIAPPSVA